MSKSTPSLLALLGLVAIAGYQNRGKITDMLTDARQQSSRSREGAASPDDADGVGGFLSEIGRLFAPGSGSGALSSGLGELVSRFKNSGRAAAPDSWVSANPNLAVDSEDFEAAIGAETMKQLVQKTGMSHAELLARLKTSLPEVVNRFTPNGRLPTADEALDYY